MRVNKDLDKVVPESGGDSSLSWLLKRKWKVWKLKHLEEKTLMKEFSQN